MNVVVTLDPENWAFLVGLDFDGSDLKTSDTLANYNKVKIMNSVSKIGFVDSRESWKSEVLQEFKDINIPKTTTNIARI